MNISENSDQQNGNKKDFLYSIPVGPKPKGQTPIYRKPAQKDGLLQIQPQIKSLSDLWDLSVKNFSQYLLIEDYSYKQVDEFAKRVGSWIVSRGHRVFFLYSTNSPNWTITDIATWNYGLVNIPLYNTLGDEAFRYILQITQGTLLFTTTNLADNLYKFISSNIYNLKQICFLDGCTNEQQSKFQNFGLKVSNFKDALDYDIIQNRPDMNLQTQISYIFTSGTTGIPKGAVYTHKMIISQCIGVSSSIQLQPNDVWISYLPIAHCFQRFAMWACIYFGTNIRYARHSIFQIFKDLAICRPTRMTIVPRLLNKFYPILKALFEKQGNHDKARSMFGGRLKSIGTGSASVSPHVLLFFCEALNITLGEGYGQTQSTAVSFATHIGDTNYGHVGGPNSVTQFKLVDVLDLNYSTDDELPKGQICMRGPSMIKKYFKDQKNTAQTIDKDGWVHTGDIGVILPNGALKIIDRKKSIYKLQQGEYVAPQKIQNIYARCKYVSETFLYGDSLRNYNVAIIHPNLENLPVLALNLGIQDKDIKNLCENKKIIQFIVAQIEKQGKQGGLHSFEQAKVIKLSHQPFLKLGILTTTMKIQRHIAKQKFKNQIAQLYK